MLIFILTAQGFSAVNLWCVCVCAGAAECMNSMLLLIYCSTWSSRIDHWCGADFYMWNTHGEWKFSAHSQIPHFSDGVFERELPRKWTQKKRKTVLLFPEAGLALWWPADKRNEAWALLEYKVFLLCLYITFTACWGIVAKFVFAARAVLLQPKVEQTNPSQPPREAVILRETLTFEAKTHLCHFPDYFSQPIRHQEHNFDLKLVNARTSGWWIGRCFCAVYAVWKVF